MKDLKESLQTDEIQLLRTGMSDNANLLNEDELGEIFGGYWCNNYYASCDADGFVICVGGY